jgi:hypothetical protein
MYKKEQETLVSSTSISVLSNSYSITIHKINAQVPRKRKESRNTQRYAISVSNHTQQSCRREITTPTKYLPAETNRHIRISLIILRHKPTPKNPPTSKSPRQTLLPLLTNTTKALSTLPKPRLIHPRTRQRRPRHNSRHHHIPPLLAIQTPFHLNSQSRPKPGLCLILMREEGLAP